jgi:hypothetical protein
LQRREHACRYLRTCRANVVFWDNPAP